MIRFILKGIDFRNPNLTRNPRLWWQYLCWCIHFGMSYEIRPHYPAFFRTWLFNHWPLARERWTITWETIENWKRIDPNWQMPLNRTPLPWYIGVAALGPFDKPWRRLANWFGSQRGGRSHRNEFTDKEMGALYGHNEGAYMDKLFDQFVKNIDEAAE